MITREVAKTVAQVGVQRIRDIEVAYMDLFK
jgi:hypothetical protein